METTTRNADIASLAHLLKDQDVRKLDLAVPASQLRSVEGNLVVTGSEPVITQDGVTTADGTYAPTSICVEGIADKLTVPVGYLKRTLTERPDLFDTNVNGWLRGRRGLVRAGTDEWVREPVPVDPRTFLLRTFRGDNNRTGIARAFLSDRYSAIDNLDCLMSVLEGIKAAGVHAEISSADLTDRRMVVRVVAPEVQALAPTLLKGYRSPFTGASGDDNPTVFAGFQISNSETGDGSFSIVPRLVVQVCNNGMTVTRDAVRRVHLGGRLEQGVIRWSETTQRKALELIHSTTTDAVSTFLNVDYMKQIIAKAERRALESIENVEVVRDLTKPLGYTKDQVEGILGHFVKGGQMTRSGVVHAVTSYAQTLPDGDDAYSLESKAMTLLGV